VEPSARHGQNGTQQGVLQEGAEPGNFIKQNRGGNRLDNETITWTAMDKQWKSSDQQYKRTMSDTQWKEKMRAKHQHHRWKAEWTYRWEPARWWPTTQMPGRVRNPSTWRTGHIAPSNK
jgi:hypothetical protein